MSRWFRLDDDVVNDPKVQRLSGDLFKAWINILCIASKNGGTLPSLTDIAFTLRVGEGKAESITTALFHAGLIDDQDGVSRPHNWDGRQHKSDVSTERVKRFRERSMKRNETVSETPPDTEQNRDRDRKKESSSSGDDGFISFWKCYPRRIGKKVAEKAYLRARREISHERIMEALAKQKPNWTDPKFIPHPATWLNQGRWDDEAAAPINGHDAPPGLVHVMRESAEWPVYAERWQAEKGHEPPTDKSGGWWFPQEMSR